MLNASIPHFYCLVRAEYLYNLREHRDDLVEAMIVGVRSRAGRALTFHVILENGAMYEGLPVTALVHKTNAPELKLEELELWDCFGENVAVTAFDALKGMNVEVYGGQIRNDWYRGTYMMTFDWWGDGFSDTPAHHKNAHLIKLENGCFALMPNNRLRWLDSSFIRPFDERPDYQINTQLFSAETGFDPKEDRFSY